MYNRSAIELVNQLFLLNFKDQSYSIFLPFSFSPSWFCELTAGWSHTNWASWGYNGRMSGVSRHGVMRIDTLYCNVRIAELPRSFRYKHSGRRISMRSRGAGLLRWEIFFRGIAGLFMTCCFGISFIPRLVTKRQDWTFIENAMH